MIKYIFHITWIEIYIQISKANKANALAVFLGHLQREKTSVCGSSNPTDLGNSVKWEGERKRYWAWGQVFSMCVSWTWLWAALIYIPSSPRRNVLTSLEPWANAHLCFHIRVCQCFLIATKSLSSIARTNGAHVPIQRLFQMFYINYHQMSYINYHSINTTDEYYFTVQMPKFKIC